MTTKPIELMTVLVSLAVCSGAFAQTISGLTGPDPGGVHNKDAVKVQQRRNQLKPDVVVFTGDTVIPHFIDGQAWQTSITLINLENHATSFSVLFFQDNGQDLYVPVLGLGLVRGVNVSLGTAASVTFETAGTALGLSSGWALLSQPNTDSVGSFAIFRHSPPGQQAQEAVVPTVNQFEDHFVLPFDNTGQYVTGVALSSPTLQAVVIPVNIRNEQGQIVDKRLFSLGAYAHSAFVLPSTWTSTAGIRGTAEFLTSGFGVGALGLRFSGNAFTSLNVLSNFSWTQ
jgi:hypothetical protein